MPTDTETKNTNEEKRGPTESEKEALKRILGIIGNKAEEADHFNRLMLQLTRRKAEEELRAMEYIAMKAKLDYERAMVELEKARIERDHVAARFTCDMGGN
ncbi:MAG TPA: hypothetical protein PLF11_15765 [Bacillota bacterium]|jgi:hypothetical protein|nr:hypothetical protein [Bacillota bacterium]